MAKVFMVKGFRVQSSEFRVGVCYWGSFFCCLRICLSSELQKYKFVLQLTVKLSNSFVEQCKKANYQTPL